MKKILISGSSGFVGSRVLHQWQGRAELFTFPRGSLAAADESAIRRFAETMQPDVILHLAALSDTGYCQQHPEESQRANVELPIWMAKATRDTGAKLISFSSDQVYAGVARPGPPARNVAALPRQYLWPPQVGGRGADPCALPGGGASAGSVDVRSAR